MGNSNLPSPLMGEGQGEGVLRYSNSKLPSPLMGEGQGEGVKKLNSFLKTSAKLLRQSSTDAETLLWKHLRAKRFKNLKFKRQEPIGKYIVDFVCYEKRIIIEVDGGQHSTDKDKDHERDNWFRGQGFKVLRFWNHEVLTQTDAVLTAMMNCFETPSSVQMKG